MNVGREKGRGRGAENGCRAKCQPSPSKRLLGFAAGVGAAFGLSLWSFSAQSPAVPFPDNPLEGRSLFQSKLCIQCHAIGDRGRSVGPSLAEGRFKGTFLELGSTLWNHAPTMSAAIEAGGLAWPQLTQKEAAQLMVFLYFIDYLGRPGQAAAGRVVFERGGCSVCHAIGDGGGKLGPDLAGLSRFASPLYVAQEIWNHGPSMFQTMRTMNLRVPRFQDGDLADLSAYIRGQAESGARQPLLLTPGSPNRGARLFASKGCSSCHGSDGRGGRGGPDLSAFELHRAAESIAGLMWNHALEMSDAMQARGIGWPRFEDSELADLVAFLYFIPFSDPPGDPARGAALFVKRTCAECHSRSDNNVDLIAGETARSPAALVGSMWNHAPIMRKAILGQGRRWPELSGDDLRHLSAYLAQQDDDRADQQ